MLSALLQNSKIPLLVPERRHSAQRSDFNEMNARPPAVWHQRAHSGLCHRCCRERRCTFSSCCDNCRCLPNTHCVVPSCSWPAVRHVSIVCCLLWICSRVREVCSGGRRPCAADGLTGRKKSCQRLCLASLEMPPPQSTLSGIHAVPRPAQCSALNSKHTCCQPPLFGGKWFFFFTRLPHAVLLCPILSVSKKRKNPWHYNIIMWMCGLSWVFFFF